MKSIWKSKSFITGLVAVIIAISTKYGFDLTPEMVEGILGTIGIVMIGKSVNKRMANGSK